MDRYGDWRHVATGCNGLVLVMFTINNREIYLRPVVAIRIVVDALSSILVEVFINC